MSKIDAVRAAMVEAMKAKDKARKDSLSMLLSALKNAEINKREPLTEEEENAVVKKEIKQTQETYEMAPADREDLDMRLFIDKRVYDRYDLSNICMKTWDVVRKLEWKEKCDPAENEELFLWNLY